MLNNFRHFGGCVLRLLSVDTDPVLIWKCNCSQIIAITYSRETYSSKRNNLRWRPISTTSNDEQLQHQMSFRVLFCHCHFFFFFPLFPPVPPYTIS